jgi:hypothetical protein
VFLSTALSTYFVVAFTYIRGTRGVSFGIADAQICSTAYRVEFSPEQEATVSRQLPVPTAGRPASLLVPEESPTPSTSHENLSRRSLFLARPGLIAATAISYARILGANGRIHLGYVGVGNRGRELPSVVAGPKSSHNVEMIPVCDLWNVNRQRAAKAAADEYGRPPLSFQRLDELGSNPCQPRNWLECLRTRYQPDASVEQGLAQSVAAIMAARAQQEGKKLYWDAPTEEIVEAFPAASKTGWRAPSKRGA